MTRQSLLAHYVRPVTATRMPRSFIYLDTEAHMTSTPAGQVQTFRLAVAAYDTYDSGRQRWRPRRWHDSTDAAELWEWITTRTGANARTVLVAHNLVYDLRLSGAHEHLNRLGWTFKAGTPQAGQAWMIYRKGAQSLVLVDSLSWVPTNLEALGEMVGIAKLPLPLETDPDDVWFARCTRDVEILAEVWDRLMTWVETEDLGSWKVTGAGQSWSAYRRRFMRHQLLYHEDDAARSAERDAAMTGRCEAWKHGKLRAGPYTEWDFETAYSVIGRDCEVPVHLVGRMARPSLKNVIEPAPHHAVLAEVEVTTDAPVIACRTGDGICWPVGSFRTCAWGLELATALAAGASVRVVRAWIYRCAPALSDFCAWVLEGIDGTRGPVDSVVRVALKHWSRAIVGRMAARHTSWSLVGHAPTSDVNIGPVFDRPADETWQMMQLGRDLFRQSPPAESADAQVAIMSYIMGEARVRLWHAMNVAGLEHVAYVDTDSVIVDPAGDAAIRAARIPGLRVKGEYRTLEILGPHKVVPGVTLRAAGIPRGAIRVGPDTWTGEVWSGPLTSFADGATDKVVVSRRVFRLTHEDKRRRHLPKGQTAPYRLEVDPATVAGDPAA